MQQAWVFQCSLLKALSEPVDGKLGLKTALSGPAESLLRASVDSPATPEGLIESLFWDYVQ